MGTSPEYGAQSQQRSDVFRGSFVYGEGVENYMNDCPYDVGVDSESGKYKNTDKR